MDGIFIGAGIGIAGLFIGMGLENLGKCIALAMIGVDWRKK